MWNFLRWLYAKFGLFLWINDSAPEGVPVCEVFGEKNPGFFLFSHGAWFCRNSFAAPIGTGSFQSDHKFGSYWFWERFALGLCCSPDFSGRKWTWNIGFSGRFLWYPKEVFQRFVIPTLQDLPMFFSWSLRLLAETDSFHSRKPAQAIFRRFCCRTEIPSYHYVCPSCQWGHRQ